MEDGLFQRWFKLSQEERALRETLAWVAYGKAHRHCRAYSDVLRPLHITALYDEDVYGFALKLSGNYTGYFVATCTSGRVSDLVYVSTTPDIRSRSIFEISRHDSELVGKWRRVVEAFLVERGLVQPRADDEPGE